MLAVGFGTLLDPHDVQLNYTGQQLDGTGLLYYGARTYDPALHRFVQADTIQPTNFKPFAMASSKAPRNVHQLVSGRPR